MLVDVYHREENMEVLTNKQVRSGSSSNELFFSARSWTSD
jgi:hypothetical protein